MPIITTRGLKTKLQGNTKWKKQVNKQIYSYRHIALFPVTQLGWGYSSYSVLGLVFEVAKTSHKQ